MWFLAGRLNHTVQIRELIKTFNGFGPSAKRLIWAERSAAFREYFRNGRDFSPSFTAQTDLRRIYVMRDEKKALRNYVNYKS